jgi:hypothetical protein
MAFYSRKNEISATKTGVFGEPGLLFTPARDGVELFYSGTYNGRSHVTAPRFLKRGAPETILRGNQQFSCTRFPLA